MERKWHKTTFITIILILLNATIISGCGFGSTSSSDNEIQSISKKDYEFDLSLGRLPIGCNVSDMNYLLGKELSQKKSYSGDTTEYIYNDIKVEVKNDKVVGITTERKSVKTEKGIHIGSSIKEMVSAYGKKCVVRDNPTYSSEYVFESSQGNGATYIFSFIPNEDIITGITLKLVDNDTKEILLRNDNVLSDDLICMRENNLKKNLKELKEYIVTTEPFFHEVDVNWKEAPSSERQFSNEEWHNLPISEKHKIIEGNLESLEYNIRLLEKLNQNLKDIPVPESAREIAAMTDKFYNNCCNAYNEYKNMGTKIYYSDESDISKIFTALKTLVSVVGLNGPSLNDIMNKRASILKEINSSEQSTEWNHGEEIPDVNTQSQEKNISSILNAQDLSLGNIKIHDSEDKVQSMLGNPVSSSNDNDSKRLRLKFKDMEVVLREGQVTALVSLSSAVTTPRGIHEGSSAQEVFDKYGTNFEKSSYGDETLYEYPIDSSEGKPCYLRFAVKNSNNEIAYISIRLKNSQTGQKQYVGTYNSGMKAYIVPGTMQVSSDRRSCNVRIIAIADNGETTYLDYRIWQNGNSLHFSNSEGYSGLITPSMDVENKIWEVAKNQ